MLASAAQAYINRYGVRPGRRAVVFTNNNSAYSVAADLAQTGIEVAAIIDSRDTVPDAAARDGFRDRDPARPCGYNYPRRSAISAVSRLRQTAAGPSGASPVICWQCRAAGTRRCTFGRSRVAPCVYDNALTSFVPDHAAQAAISVGAANGELTLAQALQSGADAGAAAADQTAPVAPEATDLAYAIEPLWRVEQTKGKGVPGHPE